MTSALPELVVVVGPTASGKTELSLRIAETLGGEIVNADSVQVYRHFDIGSAKPSLEDRARVPHHLVDLLEPTTALDAAQFAELAAQAIQGILQRGHTPVLSGGTFLWVKSLLFGLASAPPADPALRQRHRALVEKEGRPALYRELQAVDSVSAARLNPNDFVRVSRALEVYELTGRAMSELQQQHGFRTPRYRARLYGVARERAELDDRIRERTERMFQAGWIAEVEQLLARGFGSCRAMSSVGYRQIAERLRSSSTLDVAELELEVYRATRVFARRQRTWLRDQPVRFVDPELLGNSSASAWHVLLAQND